jgi:FAD/FMN-containing dehydrogenase
MSLESGIVLNVSVRPDTTAELAEHADRRGLDLVVVDGSGDVGEEPAGLDLWTTAVWIAGRTDHIQIGVVSPSSSQDPADPESAPPLMVSKAHESLDALAGTRLITSASSWTTASAHTDRDELRALSAQGRPVVVPVGSAADVDRLAEILDGEQPVTGSRPTRSAAARSRRHPGIDYDAVPGSLAGVAIEPGDPGYRAVSSTYLRGGAPGLVLRPRTPTQVRDALGFARGHRHLPLGVRSGGHGISGRSTNDGGLVIDLGDMNAIEVLDTDRRLVRIGPGATWKQVAATLDPYDWALGSGDYGGVGVGGLATAAGIGYLSRRHGLTIDHLRAVEVILADGQLVRATSDNHPDLFWAIRGAGANFGVATAFEFEVDEIGQVGFAQLLLISDNIEATLRQFGQLASTAPRDTTVFLVTGRPRQGEAMVQLYAMVDAQDPALIAERLTPFTDLGHLARHEVALTRYVDVMALAADVGPEGHHGWGEPISRSAFLPTLTDVVAHDLADLLRSGEIHFFQLRTMGGAIADVAAHETAFAHRTPAFQVTAMGADQHALNDAWDGLAHHFDGLYLSFDTDRRPQRVADAFPPPVLQRLRELKRHYDPENLFRDNFNIHPHADVPDTARDAPDDLEAA